MGGIKGNTDELRDISFKLFLFQNSNLQRFITLDGRGEGGVKNSWTVNVFLFYQTACFSLPQSLPPGMGGFIS